jgi:hypothetical protein
MKIEMIELMAQISRQATLKNLTFKESWLIFGAAMYTGWRELDYIPKDVPPWSAESELPDLKNPPNEL